MVWLTPARAEIQKQTVVTQWFGKSGKKPICLSALRLSDYSWQTEPSFICEWLQQHDDTSDQMSQLILKRSSVVPRSNWTGTRINLPRTSSGGVCKWNGKGLRPSTWAQPPLSPSPELTPSCHIISSQLLQLLHPAFEVGSEGGNAAAVRTCCTASGLPVAWQPWSLIQSFPPVVMGGLMAAKM